jgi:hypothetical protein
MLLGRSPQQRWSADLVPGHATSQGLSRIALRLRWYFSRAMEEAIVSARSVNLTDTRPARSVNLTDTRPARRVGGKMA